MPLTTIEIISSSQSLDELIGKAWGVYFPDGVRSAWIVVPALKAVHVLLPDNDNLYFSAGTLADPATGIELPVAKIFENLL